MKKRILYLAVSICILLLAAGCNTKDNSKKEEVTPTPIVTESPKDTDDGTGTADNTDDGTEGEEAEYLVNDLIKEDYNVDDYITLGQYR